MSFKFLMIVSLMIFISCATTTPESVRIPASTGESWSFIVLSDIHMYAKKQSHSYAPNKFKKVLEKLPEFAALHNTKLVILSGDITSGNVGDGVALSKVKEWWNELNNLVQPLKSAGIDVFPIAGNHDNYTKAHRDGFKYGLCLLSEIDQFCENEYLYFWNVETKEFNVSSVADRFYRIDKDSFSILNLNLPDYSMDPKQLEWIMEQSDITNGVAIGHTPINSRIANKLENSHGKKVKQALQSVKINHYITGHEHLFWDQLVGSNPAIRQTNIGTASGTYVYSPNISLIAKSCDVFKDDRKYKACQTVDQTSFLVNASNNSPKYSLQLLLVKVNQDGSYKVEPFTLKDEEFLSLYLE